MTQTMRWVLSIIMASIIVAAAGAIATRQRGPAPEVQGTVSYRAGKQLRLIYIGAEDCKASFATGFDETVIAIRDSLQRHAARKGMVFTSLGVSAGRSAASGIEYLSRFGPFDEISSGNGWINSSAVHYVWETIPGQALVPQIVVVERELNSLEPGYSFSNERIVVRALGVQQIQSWLSDGAPIS